MPSPTALGTNDLMILLALMRLGDEAYGVPIGREVEAAVGRPVALASVYATLNRLVERGLVETELGDPTPERGGRAKKYFGSPGKGIREIRSAKQSLVKLWKGLPQLG